jgi:hypothetical protein
MPETEGEFEIFYIDAGARGRIKYYKCNRCWKDGGKDCGSCGYSTYSMNELLGHIADMHGEELRKTKTVRTASSIVGPRGETLFVERDISQARFKEEE